MIVYEKNVFDMIRIVHGEITDYVKNCGIDAVVNTTNPTLMGSSLPSVDFSIHKVIDAELSNDEKFKDKIREELDCQSYAENIIRCQRGQAIVTKGYGLCKYVIHVVGPQYDGIKLNILGREEKTPFCTSSCLQKLESCYKEIIRNVKKHQDISTVAIPIIGSGSYGVPFNIAAKVALTSVTNELLEWKNSDPELFDMTAIQTIYFCVYDADEEIYERNISSIGQIWNKYKKTVLENKKIVYQNSIIAHFRYLLEIVRNDRNRGYFAVARLFRAALLLLRTLFLPILFLKDLLGQYNWQRRRFVVELTVLLKLLFPIIFYSCLNRFGAGVEEIRWGIGISLYLMCDTITYLIILIVLSDIQRPSANIIRSMIFLFVNYVEVSLDIALIYYLNNYGKIEFNEAVNWGFSLLDSGEVLCGMYNI